MLALKYLLSITVKKLWEKNGYIKKKKNYVLVWHGVHKRKQ